MDSFLRKELVEAGLRLRNAISRVVKESPECLEHKDGNWSFEFTNPATGEGIVVKYASPTMPLLPN